MGVYDSLPQDSQRYGYRIYTLVKNGPLFLSKVSELSDFIIPSQEVIDKKISFSDWISSIANKEFIHYFCKECINKIENQNLYAIHCNLCDSNQKIKEIIHT